MNKDLFKEYIKESEPTKRDKGYAWHTAIGLQAVDGLKISEYLVRTAVRNIEGEITFEEANELSALHRTSIFRFTESCLPASIPMPGEFGTTTSRGRNGC